jgi:CheY-like chemotaxis protein
MAQVLDTLYVDIVTRNFDQAKQQIRGVTDQMKQATSGTSGLAKASEGGAAGLLKMASAGLALAPVAATIALVKQGLSGTLEGDMLGAQFTQVAREVASVFLPVVQTATAVLHDLTQAFRQGGRGAQDMLLMLTGPAGMVLKVFSDPQLVGAVRRLVGAFGQVMSALAPVFGLIADVGAKILNVFVVTPLVLFAKALESIFRIAAAVAGVLVAIGRAAGLVKPPGGGMLDNRRVTLNQTGREGVEDTFGRIQDAALRAGMVSEKPRQEELLEQIDAKMETVVAFIDRWKKAANDMNPGPVAGGAMVGSRFGPGGALIGAIIGEIWGGK